MPQLGSFVIDHRSPLEQRWGGWYVTGTHGAARHMGNAMVTDPSNPRRDWRGDAQSIDAAGSRRRGVVSAPTSDIAALMVFDHQGHAINLLTRLGWETRVATAEGRLDFSKGDLRDLARETADYFAFVGRNDTRRRRFAASRNSRRRFSSTGPRDRKGRSLRELDLQTRLFKYRCSYMIYSPAFDALPPEAQAAVLARMREADHRSRHDRNPRRHESRLALMTVTVGDSLPADWAAWRAI